MMRKIHSSCIGRGFCSIVANVYEALLHMIAGSSSHVCRLFWSCGGRLVNCSAGRLLSKSNSRSSCLVVGGFSLVVMCVFHSSCGRVQLSCCGRDSMLASLFMGLSGCGVGISVLEVVVSSLS